MARSLASDHVIIYNHDPYIDRAIAGVIQHKANFS